MRGPVSEVLECLRAYPYRVGACGKVRDWHGANAPHQRRDVGQELDPGGVACNHLNPSRRVFCARVSRLLHRVRQSARTRLPGIPPPPSHLLLCSAVQALCTAAQSQTWQLLGIADGEVGGEEVGRRGTCDRDISSSPHIAIVTPALPPFFHLPPSIHFAFTFTLWCGTRLWTRSI